MITCKALILCVPWIPREIWLAARLNSAANRTTCWAEVALSQWCLLDGLSGKFDSPWATSWHKRNATKPIKADGGLHAGPWLYSAFGCTVLHWKTTIAHTSGAAQWTLESRSDRNEGSCHLRGCCGHKKPRSSLSAQMGHRGGLTVQRELLHGWVLYTYWKSIAIFQWQLQDIFEQQPLLSRVGSDLIQVFHCWKIKGVKGLFDFISAYYLFFKFLDMMGFVFTLYWCRRPDLRQTFQWWRCAQTIDWIQCHSQHKSQWNNKQLFRSFGLF